MNSRLTGGVTAAKQGPLSPVGAPRGRRDASQARWYSSEVQEHQMCLLLTGMTHEPGRGGGESAEQALLSLSPSKP